MLSDHDIILRLFGDRQAKWTFSGAYHSYLQISFAFVSQKRIKIPRTSWCHDFNSSYIYSYLLIHGCDTAWKF